MRWLPPLVALLVLAGPAGAATIRGTVHGDALAGTPLPDRIVAGKGNDHVQAAFGGADEIDCGPGLDVVSADLGDMVAPSCEIVSRRLSVDTSTNADGQHETAVEPDSFAWGSTVVAAFQLGRYTDGGAEAIGFASSPDSGRTWRSGILPGLTVGGGPWARVSDPVVAWDATHAVWLVASLAIADARNALVVSRSADGVSWAPPATAIEAAAAIAYDKEWLTCDDWPSSPRRGSCYLMWTDVLHHAVDSQVSVDGGQTWSAPVVAAASGAIAEPAVLPDGTVVVVYLVRDQGPIAAVRSTDGGATFSTPLQVAELEFDGPPGIRTPPLPSIAVDGAGRIVVAWADCRFRDVCAGNDPVFSATTDGLTWSPPARAATLPEAWSAVLATVGAGAAGRLAVGYYALGGATIGFRLTTSDDGGATWTPPRAVEAAPMNRAWLPITEGGLFLGDYEAMPFVAGRPLPIFALASSARSEAIFATTALR
jgi:hypothetical protein